MYRITCHIKSFEVFFVQQAGRTIEAIAQLVEGTPRGDESKRVCTTVFAPRHVKKLTVIRSPHIDKKARDQFELRTTKRSYRFEVSDRKSAALALELLETLQFPGVQVALEVVYPSRLPRVD